MSKRQQRKTRKPADLRNVKVVSDRNASLVLQAWQFIENIDRPKKKDVDKPAAGT